MDPRNYAKGRRKNFGDEVRVNEHSGLDQNNLPQVGDFLLLKTRAHELVEVIPSKSTPGTIRYRAIIRRLDEVPPSARKFAAGEPYIRSY
jgi:hypothetical protein